MKGGAGEEALRRKRSQREFVRSSTRKAYNAG